jgi:hypothetical protein
MMPILIVFAAYPAWGRTKAPTMNAATAKKSITDLFMRSSL